MRDRLISFYHAARHRIGRRGAALLFFAELDVIYGFALAFPPQSSPLNPTNRYFATLLPLDVWATLWILVGLTCLVHAFRRYDRHAFEAAIAIKILWGGLALIGVLFADVTIASVAIWLSLAGLVWVLSGWRESGQDAEDQETAATVREDAASARDVTPEDGVG